MDDWNVVVTVFDQRGYRVAKSILANFGVVGQTEFYNVLVVKVADIGSFTEAVDELVQRTPGVMNDISRIVPSHANFNFSNSGEFEERARETLLVWADDFADRSFYVRLHRRGLKGQISSPVEERFLDDVLLGKLERIGKPGRIAFEDPDMVIDIETVENRAGISKWSREDLHRFSFLEID